MSDFPTVDRVIADLKRLAGGTWNTDREREICNVMVDARHCLEQLVSETQQGPMLADEERGAIDFAAWDLESAAGLANEPSNAAAAARDAAILRRLLDRTAVRLPDRKN